MYLDYPGTGTASWNQTYFGLGDKHDHPQRGSQFPNTAYVHTYTRTISNYEEQYDPVTVIQYHYFYPYNDWWNNHEGDWQRIDVVVSSGDPDTAVLLGVEYRFHKAWLSYYRDWANKPGLTTSFSFNPRTALKVSPGPERNEVVQYTHPVVYVGAGSHAATVPLQVSWPMMAGAKARADTFSSLTNGTAYAFEVRAENARARGRPPRTRRPRPDSPGRRRAWPRPGPGPARRRSAGRRPTPTARTSAATSVDAGSAPRAPGGAGSR